MKSLILFSILISGALCGRKNRRNLFDKGNEAIERFGESYSDGQEYNLEAQEYNLEAQEFNLEGQEFNLQGQEYTYGAEEVSELEDGGDLPLRSSKSKKKKKIAGSFDEDGGELVLRGSKGKKGKKNGGNIGGSVNGENWDINSYYDEIYDGSTGDINDGSVNGGYLGIEGGDVEVIDGGDTFSQTVEGFENGGELRIPGTKGKKSKKIGGTISGKKKSKLRAAPIEEFTGGIGGPVNEWEVDGYSADGLTGGFDGGSLNSGYLGTDGLNYAGHNLGGEFEGGNVGGIGGGDPFSQAAGIASDTAGTIGGGGGANGLNRLGGARLDGNTNGRIGSRHGGLGGNGLIGNGLGGNGLGGNGLGAGQGGLDASLSGALAGGVGSNGAGGGQAGLAGVATLSGSIKANRQSGLSASLSASASASGSIVGNGGVDGQNGGILQAGHDVISSGLGKGKRKGRRDRVLGGLVR